MACELEPLLIQQSDFDCVGQVARHCDWDQLCIYIREQQNLSLLPKIGQCLWNMILCYKQHEAQQADDCGITWDTDTEERFQNLICGGTFEGCNGVTMRHFGLQRMLVHYSYGAYVFRHGFQDTAFGVVQKINQDSVPAPIKELRDIMREQQNAAEQYWRMTKDYLCTLREIAPFNDCLDCIGCECDCKCNHCKKSRTIQGRGVEFGNVSKW